MKDYLFSGVEVLFIALIVALITMLITSAMSYHCTRATFQREAVANGAAKFVLDGAYGNKFEWNSNREKQ